MPRIETICEIRAPHFVCGIVAEHGRVIEAPPIVRYMKGWDGKRVSDYCKNKGWKLSVVSKTESNLPE